MSVSRADGAGLGSRALPRASRGRSSMVAGQVKALVNGGEAEIKEGRRRWTIGREGRTEGRTEVERDYGEMLDNVGWETGVG